MSENLSTGALATIMQGGEYSEPVVQVLSIKKMNSGSGQPEKDRYRIFLSDGQYTVSFAMMTAQIYAKAGDKGLPKFSIIKIIRSMTSVINNTEGRDSRVLLILDLELLKDGDEVGVKIGDPVPYSEAANAKKATLPSSGPDSGNNKPSGVEPAAKRMKLATTSNGNGNTTIGLGHITHPISSLSPYHNKWVIKVRVMSKSDIRKWENARGSGQLFSCDLCDESGEIRLTAFGNTVDKFFDLIQPDKVYYISKCQVKPANKQFTSLKNDYEMTMTNETEVVECLDDDMKNLKIQYDFMEIAKLAEVEANATVDVLAIAKSAGDINTFQAKSTGRELKKREVQLIDQSNATITLTLWGQQAENFNGFDNPVILLKGARVGEFGGGKNLSTISSTIMKVNPDMQESFTLKGWFNSQSSTANLVDLSARTGGGTGSYNTPWLTFKEVVDQQFGSINTTTGDYYMVKATVLLIRAENAVYKACAATGCNKKVVDNNDGTYRCEKCQQDFPNYKYRLLCSMNVGDWSGNQWVSMFSDEAEKVIGMPAQEVGELWERDPEALSKVMENVHFKEFVLRCRAKMETYNDEQRLKTVAVRVDPINHKEYNAYLAKKIKELAIN